MRAGLDSGLAAAIAAALSQPRKASSGGGGSPSLTTQVTAIFAATSAKGYMLNVQDIATLSQDTAGATPVVNVSDVIGRIADLSGNGNHFTQATAANKPAWNGNGADFDGAGDGLARVALDLSGATHVYVAFAGQKTTGNNNACIMFHSVTPSFQDGSVALWANGGSVANFQHNVRGVTSQAQARLSHPSDVLASSVSYWNLTVGTSLDTQLDVWHNGVPVTIGVGSNTGIGPLTTQTHYIGSTGSYHFSGNGRRYAVLATASALTAPQLATLIAWAEEGRLGFP